MDVPKSENEIQGRYIPLIISISIVTLICALMYLKKCIHNIYVKYRRVPSRTVHRNNVPQDRYREQAQSFS